MRFREGKDYTQAHIVSYRLSQTHNLEPKFGTRLLSPYLPACPWTLAQMKLIKTVDIERTVH